jgi:hypothetical protein
MNYPVKRGSRLDRLSLATINDWVVEGMNIVEGITSQEALDGELTSRSPEYIAGHADPDALGMFCRLAIYTDAGKNGKRPQLESNTGKKFSVPGLREGTPADFAQAYYDWLDMDEDKQQAIDDLIVEKNKALAPRHTLPAEMLTEEEKADPNS